MPASRDPLSKLDSDNIAQVIVYLEPLDIVVLQRVSRAWKTVLSSDWVSRLALVHHFPTASETIALREAQGNTAPTTNAELSFRRCLYRMHTRNMGCPTTASHMMLQPLGAVGWGIVGDYVCWMTRSMCSLHVQRVSGGASTRRCVKFLDVAKRHQLPVGIDDLSNGIMDIRVSDGGSVLSVTINCYDDVGDDNEYGRRAFVLAFALEDLEFLWCHAICAPFKMLGDVHQTKEQLVYVRKTMVAPEDVTVHLMVHNLHNGMKVGEILLEGGGEISHGGMIFVVASDNLLKRLVVIWEAATVIWAHIYTIYDNTTAHPPGKLLGSYEIRSERASAPIPAKVRVSSNLDMNLPTRLGTFHLVESLYIYADKSHDEDLAPHDSPDEDAIPHDIEADLLRLGRALSGHLGAYNPIHLHPPTIDYTVWTIRPCLTFEVRRFRAQLDLSRDFSHHNYQDNVDVCCRFEVFLPLERCSAILCRVAPGRFACDIAAYHSTPGVMIQHSRRALSARRLVWGKESAEYTEDGTPYLVDGETLDISLKGEVSPHSHQDVVWSESRLAVRCMWRSTSAGRADRTGIVVFDFSPPW